MAEDFNNLEQADEIKLLQWPECVKARPGMYIGGTDASCVSTLLREIIDNATDECQKGADCVVIDRDFNGLTLVADNGRGISIEYNKTVPGVISADLSISSLHSGSKFMDNKGATVGQNGVGSACTNALSSDYILMSRITPLNFDKSLPEVRKLWESCGPRSKKDLFYIVWYKQGIKHYEGAHKKVDIEHQLFGKAGYKEIPSGMSTIVMFNPDPTVFTEGTKMNVPMENLQYFLLIQEKFYGKKVNLWVDGTKIETSGFVGFRNEIFKTIVPADPSANEKIDVYISFEADPELSPKSEFGSVNGLVVNSGVHLSYVEDCFEKALRETYGIKHRFVHNGLRLLVIALASEAVFSSQTKEKLKSFLKVKPTDFEPLVKEFQKVFRKDSEYWGQHVSNLNYLADSLKALSATDKAQRMIDSASGNSYYRSKSDLVDGFADATARDRWNCELFITEGLSPCGSLKKARKVRNGAIYEAVLPLKGKILNVSEVDIDRALENKEISTIFTLLGVGIQEHNVTSGCKTIEEAFEALQKYARFGKICISVDADSDGSQICSLILYLFSKYARFLIDLGCVYIVKAPLFEQGGKYWYPGDPMSPDTHLPIGLDEKKPFSRWKGLGSMNSDEVHKAFFNPITRKLIQVTPENISEAMALTEDIEVRKKLLWDAGILTNPFGLND